MISFEQALAAVDSTLRRAATGLVVREVGSGTNPVCASGVTDGNPLHEDMMEIAALALARRHGAGSVLPAASAAQAGAGGSH